VTENDLEIVPADPLGGDALRLLHKAAVEARALYPELHAPDAPWPTNSPTPPGGVYLPGYSGGQVVACGFRRIPPFGASVDDPTSICFEKLIVPGESSAV
jgi:hypothetical protein